MDEKVDKTGTSAKLTKTKETSLNCQSLIDWRGDSAIGLDKCGYCDYIDSSGNMTELRCSEGNPAPNTMIMG